MNNQFTFTQEQINQRKSDSVCFNCGVNFLTKKQKTSGGSVATFSIGECCLCNQTTKVTNIRTYNYLKIPKE
jgi:hypothetical protein